MQHFNKHNKHLSKHLNKHVNSLSTTCQQHVNEHLNNMSTNISTNMSTTCQRTHGGNDECGMPGKSLDTSAIGQVGVLSLVTMFWWYFHHGYRLGYKSTFQRCYSATVPRLSTCHPQQVKLYTPHNESQSLRSKEAAVNSENPQLG